MGVFYQKKSPLSRKKKFRPERASVANFFPDVAESVHIQALQEEFLACRKLFTALGDETRQELLCALLAGPCQGSRGVELAEKIHLSRPAVSHHLQILKEAGIVRAWREGTYIYYYLNPQDGEIQRVLRLFQSIQQVMASAPDREGEP